MASASRGGRDWEEFPSSREFEELLTDFDTAGVEILDDPKLEFEKKGDDSPDDGDDLADIECYNGADRVFPAILRLNECDFAVSGSRRGV